MVYIGWAWTFIDATSMIVLVNEVLDPVVSDQKTYVGVPPADLALTRNKTVGELIKELSRNVTLSLSVAPDYSK
jgi:hypothetical protein